jgi:hypothetical protein
MLSALLWAAFFFMAGALMIVGALKALPQKGQALPTFSSSAAPQDGQALFGDIFSPILESCIFQPFFGWS